MVKPFSRCRAATRSRQVHDVPVQSEFGWHIIKLEGTRPTTPPPFDAVKAQITPMVNQKKFAKHLDEIVAKAKVEKAEQPTA